MYVCMYIYIYIYGLTCPAGTDGGGGGDAAAHGGRATSPGPASEPRFFRTFTSKSLKDFYRRVLS